MKVEIIGESGFLEALFGLGLSYGITSGMTFDTFKDSRNIIDKVREASLKLYTKEGGHNKFLESIQMWLDVTAPRYIWAEIDTYRVGCSKQSESTIHTLTKSPFVQGMFCRPVPAEVLGSLEELRIKGDFVGLKNILPEGFLQRRIWNLNYKVLRNILSQRKRHRLSEWQYFCDYIYTYCKYPIYISDIML